MPGSLLGPTVDVPCYHHQAVDTLGEGLKATAWALDETVEAVWNPDRRFLLAVQWHPEIRDDPALFAALVRAATR
jgi:anthranilate synthase component 2/putative glutamine amidotransferase